MTEIFNVNLSLSCPIWNNPVKNLFYWLYLYKNVSKFLVNNCTNFLFLINDATGRLLAPRAHFTRARMSHVFSYGRSVHRTFIWHFPWFSDAYLFTTFSQSSRFVISKSSSPISPSLRIGPTWAPPLRKFWYADRSAETCSVWTSTVTVARAVTRVTVELDESESTVGVLLRCERLMLLWGTLLWRVCLPPELDDFSSCRALVSPM